MFFRLSFVTLIFAAVALGTPVKRDAATVALAIQNLAGPLQTLDKGITVVSGINVRDTKLTFEKS